MVVLYFKERGHEVTGFSRRPISYARNILGDALNEEDVRAALFADDFDAVVNCIGLLNQFAESDKAGAVFLNGYLPHRIASWLANCKTRLVHMSTDCVFAGNTGPYTE